jgi:hypothetical protein
MGVAVTVLYGPRPIALTALTLQVYKVPLVRPPAVHVPPEIKVLTPLPPPVQFMS